MGMCFSKLEEIQENAGAYDKNPSVYSSSGYNLQVQLCITISEHEPVHLGDATNQTSHSYLEKYNIMHNII